MPNAEDLFREHFLPSYPPDAAADLALARATDRNPANNPSVTAHLDEAATIFAKMHAAVLGRELSLDRSDASVHRLGAALDRSVRDRLGRERAGTESLLFQFVVHGSAYVGACIVQNHGARWGVRRPLWESVVRLTSHAGEGDLPVFHWWLKSLADDAFAEDGSVRYGLGERYRTHVEVPRMDPAALPVFVTGERKLPRLTKVRYDVLYKYLKAHLPELKDLGADFPSPERFDAYRFKWLEAHVLGGGRMVLLAGLGEGGLHAFWLDGKGFQKAALFAAEAFPEPRVVVAGDKLQLHVAHDGKAQMHELLWWGP
jgi:hypothetical protein